MSKYIFGISYVKKDNRKDSVEGYSLYVKYLKGWSEEHIEEKFKKSKLYFTNKEWISLADSNGSNIRSIWKESK